MSELKKKMDKLRLKFYKISVFVNIMHHFVSILSYFVKKNTLKIDIFDMSDTKKKCVYLPCKFKPKFNSKHINSFDNDINLPVGKC